jgi:predicted Ser/Thr protein kinase
MNKIELYVNKTDYALMKSALNDLLDKVNANSDFYGVAGNITDLLNQLQESHYILEGK